MSQARTLVTSYCFPPYREATAVSAAKRVREFGSPVDVICNAMTSGGARDPSLTRICGDLVRRFAAVASPTGFASWSSVRSYVDLGYRTATRWEHAQGPYSRLYSRAQFVHSHFLAARYKTSHPSIEWVAEFSDPLSRDTLGRVRHKDLDEDHLTQALSRSVEAHGHRVPRGHNIYEWCEAVTFALADQIIFTNELQREYMLSTCHDPALAERARDHSVVSPHPTLPRDFYTVARSDYDLPRDRINIGYFGSFFVNRGVGLILDALRALPEETTRRLRFHIFTNKPSDIATHLRGSTIEHAVVAHPYVDYLEFLSLTDRMDLLLVNDAITPRGAAVNPYLPSKWSDYKGSHTPVWAIIEEGSTLYSEPGIAYRTPVEHLTAIQQVLSELAADGVRAAPGAAQ